MAVPGHRYDCSSKLWRTRCPTCRKTVFFFSCSCGSRVFFDAAGDPWPRHEGCTAPEFLDSDAERRSGAEGLPLLVVSPAGDERQVAGTVVRARDASVRGQRYVEVTLADVEGAPGRFKMRVEFLVPRGLYLKLHCQPGDDLWALLTPPQADNELWIADEVELLR